MLLELRENQDLEQLIERSRTDPVLIFKHSTQCPISSHVYEEFSRFAASSAGPTCGVLLVIENRALSDIVAARLGVRHESPQAIVIHNGKATWSASHWSITAEALAEALRK
jgi:bacillithiol system protein YtxJ